MLDARWLGWLMQDADGWMAREMHDGDGGIKRDESGEGA
jgi:hypothetical protein